MKYLLILPLVFFLDGDIATDYDDVMAHREPAPEGHFLCHQKSIKAKWLNYFFQCDKVETAI